MIEHKGIAWKLYQNILLPDVAPHTRLVVSKDDCQTLLQRTNAFMVRWTSHFDHPEPTLFWYVIKDNPPSMDELSSNTKSKIRRGLKRCRVAPTDATVIAEDGYQVYRKAFERYETFVLPLNQDEFFTHITALGDDPSWEFWGVWDYQGNLIAYSQNQIQSNICNYSTIKFHPDYLKFYPSYALFFEMNNHYLNDQKLRYVNDGARSISHITNIQTFLIEKFKFRKSYSHLHIVYSRKVGLAVRILYPFRSNIAKIPNSISSKVSVLLNQEEIFRSFSD